MVPNFKTSTMLTLTIIMAEFFGAETQCWKRRYVRPYVCPIKTRASIHVSKT